MILKDLRKDISEMTDEELREALTKIRASRRYPRTGTKKEKKPKPDKVIDISGMTPEDARELLNLLRR